MSISTKRTGSTVRTILLALLLQVAIFPSFAQTNFKDGPGGPILVIGSTSNPFSTFTAEMLRAEGWNEFKVLDISAVTAATLTSYDVVILGDIPLSSTQVSMLSSWTNAGGTLIAFSPDTQLAGLMGLTATGGTLSDKYLLVNSTVSPGLGIVGQTMQFHGTADLYTANAGTTIVAMLYSGATTATGNPAVTIRNVGTAGGQAVAFTYDLARSVVYTRQGNPAWAGTKRDGQTGPVRTDDMFFPDWIDLNKVAIPQADEQMRLMSNIILAGNADRKPLPRFWFLPKGKNAAVVMTGDDHATLNRSTVNRFNAYVSATTNNTAQDVLDWNAVRATSYLFPGSGIADSDVVKYQNMGFELGLHMNTNCSDFTLTSWNNYWSTQNSSLKAQLPSLAPQVTHRTHCIAWSDWATQPKAESALGIRFDVNYYYWPDTWVNDRPGMFTGSGMPMRFADLDGSMIDVYQAPTQMTDESGQTYPKNANALLDSAVGAPGYYGVFVANMHTDIYPHAGSDAIVSAALAREVPVVSAKMMMDWVDGRNASSFSGISWSGNNLTFTVTQDARARNLKGMLPIKSGTTQLTGISRSGVAVSFVKRTVKGVEYAFFDAVGGTYVASYGTDTTPPSITNVSATANNDGTATITWTTNEAANSRVDYGTAANALVSSINDPANLVTSHTVKLSGLTNSTTYYYRVTSADASSNSTQSPVAASSPLSFTVPASACPCSVMTTTPAFTGPYNDGQGIELGMKFRVTSAGTITGVKFYKDAANIGTHTGQLYTSTGTLLASAVFTGESASGWQTVTFQTPVSVVPNTTYVVAYHSASGYYSAATNFFTTAIVNGPLRGLADGEDGGNGLYMYAASPAFPTGSFNKANYGVDVVFTIPTPVDATAPVISNVVATTAAGGTATITWTTNEASDSRLDYGTTTTALNQSVTNASLVTAHTVKLTGLTGSTTYYFRVTSRDSSLNAATSPLASANPASFTVPAAIVTICGSDDTNTQFASGTLGNSLLSVADSNGAVILKPVLSEDFTGNSMPSGWNQGNWQFFGASTGYGGAATVNGARISTNANYSSGAAIEFSARFTQKDYQVVGFMTNGLLTNTPWVGIGRSVAGSNTGVYLTTSNGTSILLGNNLLNAYHRYKLVWNANSFTAWVDGVQVATQNMSVFNGMTATISDYYLGTNNLAVDWIRVTPYASSGTFTSRVIDAGSVIFWKTASWSSLVPAGTSITVSYRTGNTATPDASWSAWTVVSNGGGLAGNTRYLQYQAVLNTTDPRSTPVLKGISFGCSLSPAVAKMQGSPIIDQTVPFQAYNFELGQNHPNPSTGSTVIGYSVARTTRVRFTVYDLYGRVVRVMEEGDREPGKYSLGVDLHGLAKGIYVYRMQAGEFTATRKMILE